MFITNDYPHGFVIEDSLGKIHWLITDRNWAGMAIAPEFIRANIIGEVEFIEIEKVLICEREYIQASFDGEIKIPYASEVYKFANISNFSITLVDDDLVEYEDYGYRLLVEFDYGITKINKLDFTLKDENDVTFSIDIITKVNDKNYIFETSNFNDASGDLTLSFTTGYTKGEADQDIGDFSTTFAPINLVPTGGGVPKVEVIYNE